MNPDFTVDLESFDIVETLGEGSFGKVYLSRQKNTNKQFAAKVLNFQLPDKSNFQELLE